jgi:Type II secretory pathway, component PulD
MEKSFIFFKQTFNLSMLSASIILGGCSLHKNISEYEINKLNKLKDSAENNPAKYKLDYTYKQRELIDKKLILAQQAFLNGDFNTALSLNQDVLKIDSENMVAIDNINKIDKIKDLDLQFEVAQKAADQGNISAALVTLREILQVSPNYYKANKLKKEIEQNKNRNLLNPPSLNEKLDQLVSLDFKNAPVSSVLDFLAQYSGMNFILDKDANLDQVTTTVYAKNTTVREALKTILSTSSLAYKILNSNSYLIYQQSPEKKKKYEELVTKSFYLGFADVQKTQDLITKLYEPKAIFFDDRLRLLIVRDNQNVIDSIDKLLQAFDLPSPEVILDIEVLEVSRDNLLELGIDFPKKVDVSLLNGVGGVGSYTINQLRNLTSDSLKLVTADRIATVNFQQTSSKANLLANPRIRVKSKEKADFLIGEKVPVITTTTSELGGSIAESINYLDVGLKLEVLPEVKVNKEVQIGIKMEVSNIAKEITSKNGLIAYQIGTRNASTTLQLKDNETQMLAGLIRDDTQTSATHLPGIGKIPLLGRLFSSTRDTKNKSEIVLLITPRIVRPFELPAPYVQEHLSGTGDEVTTTPLRLMDHSIYQGKADLSQSNTPASISVPNTPESANQSEAQQVGTNTNNIDFKLESNDQVKAGEILKIKILQNAPNAQKISLDIQHSDKLEFSEMVLGIAAQKVEKEKIAGGTRIIFFQTPAHQGETATINFRVSKDLEGNQKVAISNYSIDTVAGSTVKKDASKQIYKEFIVMKP